MFVNLKMALLSRVQTLVRIWLLILQDRKSYPLRRMGRATTVPTQSAALADSRSLLNEKS